MKITINQLKELISEQIKVIKEASVPADIKKDLADFCKKVWDGDVSPEEIYKSNERSQMQQAMNVYNKHKNTIFKDGVPFPGDDKKYDELLKTSPGAKYMKTLIDREEGGRE
jgi:hypothetical protein